MSVGHTKRRKINKLNGFVELFSYFLKPNMYMIMIAYVKRFSCLEFARQKFSFLV